MRVNTRRVPRFLVGLCCGVVLVFAGRWVINETTLADWLVSPLLMRDTNGPVDAIVVLGAGVIGECTPNHYALRRVLLAARQWKEGRTAPLVFTGGGGRRCPVAAAMAKTAMEIGVPESSIRVETASSTTRENGEFMAPLLRGWGVRRILLVTDRLHMRRAAGVFTQLGFHVEQASVPVYEGHADNVSMLAAGAREALAITYYRMRGWLGEPHDGSSQHTAPVRRAGMPIRDTGPVVLLGASYAEGWRLTSVGDVPVVNRGIGGQQSFEMLERFERDVTAAQPRAVIIWGFINDIYRAQDVDSATARIQASYISMIALARQHGIEPVLATEVTVRPPALWSETVASWVGAVMRKTSYQDAINQHVLRTNRWVLDLAAREGLLVLDLQPVIADQRGLRRRLFAQPDGSHISSAGYAALTSYAMPILEQYLLGSRDGS